MKPTPTPLEEVARTALRLDDLADQLHAMGHPAAKYVRHHAQQIYAQAQAAHYQTGYEPSLRTRKSETY